MAVNMLLELVNLIPLQDSSIVLPTDLWGDAFVIAQFKDNLFNDFQGSWDNFVQSGQAWALLIGVVVGYIIRSVTSF
jgi:hypothetical protein